MGHESIEVGPAVSPLKKERKKMEWIRKLKSASNKGSQFGFVTPVSMCAPRSGYIPGQYVKCILFVQRA